MLGTWIRPKEVGKILLEIVLGFPSSFFLSMIVPKDLVHFNLCSSGTSFLSVEDFHWIDAAHMIDLTLFPSLVIQQFPQEL